MESSRCFNVVSRLLRITTHSHIGVDANSHQCIVTQKKAYSNSKPVKLHSSWSRVSVISNGFSAVGKNFLAICCHICGHAIDLQLRFLLGGLAKAQAQQAQIDLRRLYCLVSRELSLSYSIRLGFLVRLAKDIMARYCRKSAGCFLCRYR